MSNFNIYKTIGYAIIHTSRLLANKMNDDMGNMCCEGNSVTREQGAVLLMISQGKEQEVIQQDIAEVMDKSKSAILRTIDILEKKGYVTRMPVLDDRRKNRLQVTETGLVIAEQVKEMVKKKNCDLTELIGEQDLATFFKVLEIIQNKLEAEEKTVEHAA